VKQNAHSPFQTYQLPDVLYSNQRLILNPHDRILTLLDDADGVSAQACLSVQAWALTRALLDAHPAPCSQAALYAAFVGVEVEVAQEILTALFEAGVLDVALRYGLGEAMADCRTQLALYNLGIQPVPEEESYRLFRLSLV